MESPSEEEVSSSGKELVLAKPKSYEIDLAKKLSGVSLKRKIKDNVDVIPPKRRKDLVPPVDILPTTTDVTGVEKGGQSSVSEGGSSMKAKLSKKKGIYGKGRGSSGLVDV